MRVGGAVLLLAVVLTPVPAAADCAAPEVFAGAGDRVRGEVTTIEGSGFRECNDVVSGCSASGNAPLDSVALTMVGDSGVVLRQEVSPDADGSFRVEVRIPPDVSPGLYEVVATEPGGTTEASTQITVD